MMKAQKKSSNECGRALITESFLFKNFFPERPWRGAAAQNMQGRGVHFSSLFAVKCYMVKMQGKCSNQCCRVLKAKSFLADNFFPESSWKKTLLTWGYYKHGK